MRLPSFLAAALIGSSPAFAAEPLLVPEATPATPNEFALAVMIGGQVQDRLLQDGYIVLTEPVVTPVVGQGALENCAMRSNCPQDVLPKLPARAAVVMLVSRDVGGNLIAYVRIYVGSQASPVVGRDVPVVPGQEYLVSDQVSAAVRELLSMVGPSSDAVLMAAARMIAGQPPIAQPAPMPAPVPIGPPAPIVDLDTPVTPTRAAGTPDTRPLDEILADTGLMPRHITGSEKSLRKAGVDPRDWYYDNSPHAGRLIVEVQAGLGVGDTDRAADIRTNIVDGVQTGWYQEGPLYARHPRGGVFIGYAPATFLDFGVFGGLQYNQRHITLGWASTTNGSTSSNITPAVTVEALSLEVDPRLRAYIVPLGVAKPYVFTGPSFLVFNKYNIDQPTAFTYLVPPGGVTAGFGGGGGLLIDPGPIIGFYAEGSFTQYFGLRAGPAQSGTWPYPPPTPPDATGHLITVSGGVQFRI